MMQQCHLMKKFKLTMLFHLSEEKKKKKKALW